MLKLDRDLLNKYVLNGDLRVVKHPTYDLWTYKYTQEHFFKDSWDDITLLCRGIVVDSNGFVIARPFTKFFNIEQVQLPEFNSFEVYDKVDGSLIILFNYNGEWLTSTTGSFTSEHSIRALGLLDTHLLDIHLSKNHTYLFEFTSPDFKIVIDYGNTDRLTLLAAINTETGVELNYNELTDVVNSLNQTGNGIQLVKRYDGFNDYNTLKKIIGDNDEVFVVKFPNGERVKIKGENYIRLHGLLTNMSTTSVWDILRHCGSIEDVLTNVPDEFFQRVHSYANELIDQYNNVYVEFYNIYNMIRTDDRKIFASIALQYNHSTILFSLYNGKNPHDYIWKLIRPDYKRL